MNGPGDVEVGQVWESNDGARQVHVERVSPRPDGFIGVRGARRSDVRVSTLRRRYRLVRRADGTPVTT